MSKCIIAKERRRAVTLYDKIRSEQSDEISYDGCMLKQFRRVILNKEAVYSTDTK